MPVFLIPWQEPDLCVLNDGQPQSDILSGDTADRDKTAETLAPSFHD